MSRRPLIALLALVPLVAAPVAAQSKSSTEPQRGKVAPKEPGRAAPPTASGPLRFNKIRVFRDGATGRNAGRANITNRRKTYLNRVRFRWRLVSAKGRTLDRGTASWPTLAPGETATVSFKGRHRHTGGWKRVRFTYVR